MSSRLGQTISRYNAALGHIQDGTGQQGQVQPDPFSGSTGGNTGVSCESAHAIAHQPPPSHYKGHRGHRRGHSYGGVVSPPSSGIHHSQLEARPSHPNTHHGALLSHGSSALQKGHRRALSGCLPMVGMGAVAWSSLRDLESANSPGSHFTSIAPVRSLSPEETRSRPSSPDGILDYKGPQKLAAGGSSGASGGGAGGISSPSGCGVIIPDSKKHENLKTLAGMECGLGPCKLPHCFQSLANIQFFVFILAVLVTLQQAVASGYVNSVITTIETRFEIPSRFSGLIASSYEMGNVVTVLFVSYLGAKRHIPRWIATGVLVMVIGCVVFTLPHFLNPEQVHLRDESSLVNGQYVRSVLSSASASPKINSFLEKDRLKNESGEGSRQGGNGGDGIPYNSTRDNDTILHLEHRAALIQDTSTAPSIAQHSSYRPGGRNSICHSANPQSSRFISATSTNSRLNNHVDLNELGNGEPENVRQELMSVGCAVEVIEKDGTRTTTASQESYGHPLILFMLAQLLLGCGGSPLFTLGITYVDDHVPADSSSVYIGTIYAMAAFGPVLGFLVGAWMLSIPSSVSHLTNPDAQFTGLWWGGYLIAGGLLFIAALPFLLFPRIKATKSVDEEPSSTSSDETSSITESKQEALNSGAYGQSIKDIPRSIWRLITNPTYVLTCLGGCMELNIVSGFVVFLPKYLETQFSLGKSEASLYTGGIAIPGACFGIFFGGYLVKRMQMKPSGACKFVVTTNIICLIGYVFFFFLGCSNPNLAGATTPYPGNPEPTSFAPLDTNLTSSCNSQCSCDSSLDAQYVCHEGVTFFSPCHAGCSVNLTQCACAGGVSVTPGRCPDKPCNTLLPFMIVLFFMTATVAVTQMPLLMIVLRSVSPEERSFALGMQFVIFRLLGYIPSPIVFGSVIDSACLLWSIKRCSTLLPAVSGRCLLYDVQDFRYKYVGMLSGLKLLALALFLYDLYQLRKIEKDEEAEEAANNALEGSNLKATSNSTISLDKLCQESDTGSVTTITTTATTISPSVLPAPSSIITTANEISSSSSCGPLNNFELHHHHHVD